MVLPQSLSIKPCFACWARWVCGLTMMVFLGMAVHAETQPAPAFASAPVQQLQAELPERKLPGLDVVLRKGLVNGPDILIREWYAAAAKEEVTIGRSPMLPNASAWARPGVIYEQHRDDGTSRTVTAVLFNLRFYQPVYQWGALEKGYQITQIRKAMADRNVGETRRMLALDLRRRYFDWVLAGNALRLARVRLARLEADREFVKQGIAEGSVAPGAIDGANREIDMQKPAVARCENEYAALRTSLMQITGLPEPAFEKVPGEIPEIAGITDALTALSNSVSAPLSARVENMTDDTKIEKLNYEIAKKRLYPKFGVELSVNQDDRRAPGDTLGQKSLITSYNALLAVDWTLFDGFASQAAKRATLNRVRAYETSRAAVEQQENQERRAEIVKLQVAWQELQNAERDLSRTRGSVDVIMQDFANGMTPQSTVDNARATLDSTFQTIYTARATFYTALAACLSNRGQDPIINEGGF